MGRVSDDPRVYLREAVALADRVMRRPGDEDAAIKLAPQLAKRPYAETMLLVEGLDQPKAHVEIVVIASRRK